MIFYKSNLNSALSWPVKVNEYDSLPLPQPDRALINRHYQCRADNRGKQMIRRMGRVMGMTPLEAGGYASQEVEQIEIGPGVKIGRRYGGRAMEHKQTHMTVFAPGLFGKGIGKVYHLAAVLRGNGDNHASIVPKHPVRL